MQENDVWSDLRIFGILDTRLPRTNSMGPARTHAFSAWRKLVLFSLSLYCLLGPIIVQPQRREAPTACGQVMALIKFNFSFSPDCFWGNRRLLSVLEKVLPISTPKSFRLSSDDFAFSSSSPSRVVLDTLGMPCRQKRHECLQEGEREGRGA